jgi:hypothetical protein
LSLAASDEPNWFGIQLYHLVATQADVNGKQVLDVSCGHGGGGLVPGAHVAPGLLTRAWTSTQTASTFAEGDMICPGWISCTVTPKVCRLPTNLSTR